MDAITIEILDNGRMKIETDQVSMPNHANAEGFIRELIRLGGGPVDQKHKHGHNHNHQHTHSHEHEHEHTHN